MPRMKSIPSAAPVFQEAMKVSNAPTFSGDAGYQGTAESFVRDQLKLTLHIAQKPAATKVNSSSFLNAGLSSDLLARSFPETCKGF
ncbi:MAG: hypothetical protein R3F36_05820 [Candidatus Competibacteraceae bacterium]